MAAWTRHLTAIVRQRCPRCLDGRVFAGIVRMNEYCPVCGLHFEREQGYFLGAMYVSYLLGAAVLGALVGIAHTFLLPEAPFEWALAAAAVPFLLVVPALFRCSRIIWMHFERWADPTPEPSGQADDTRGTGGDRR